MLPSTLPQPRCLVVEDQALIGMALEDYLHEAGMQIVGPFASCDRALAWAQVETPDVALLDYRLKDGFCTEVARTLLQRGVPVIIYSGYPQGADLPEELRHVTWVEKPVDRATLLDVLMGSCRSGPVAKAS
jgi:DNA-binding response OmpR family regulator